MIRRSNFMRLNFTFLGYQIICWSWDQIILPVFMRSKFLIMIWSPESWSRHFSWDQNFKKALWGNFDLIIDLLVTSTIIRSNSKSIITKQWPLARYLRGLTQVLTNRRALALSVWWVRPKLFGKCLRVWQVRAKSFGNCLQVWRVLQVHEYTSTQQSAHDKVCSFMHRKHILYL